MSSSFSLSLDQFFEGFFDDPPPNTTGTLANVVESPTETPEERGPVGNEATLPNKRKRSNRVCLRDLFVKTNTNKGKPGRPPKFQGECPCLRCSRPKDPDADYVPPTKYKYTRWSHFSLDGENVLSIREEKHNLPRGSEIPSPTELPAKARKPGSGLHMRKTKSSPDA
jgi:hypothetical protein